MLNIVLTLIPVFGIMFLGGMAQRLQLLPANSALCLNKFIYWFSLPMLLFYLMASTKFTDISVMSVWGCVLALLIVQFLVAAILVWRKMPLKDAFMGGMTACFPNTAFMGIPIIMLLFPDDATARGIAGLVALVPTVPFVITDVFLSVQAQEKSSMKGTLGNICQALYKNPALIASVAGMAVGFGDITLPAPIVQIAKMLGDTASPCALFCMGLALAEQLRLWSQGSKIAWDVQGILLGSKLFLVPVLVFVLVSLMGGEGVALATMTVQTALPSAVLCHILAVKHQALQEGCATAVLIGTFISVLILPPVIAIVQGLAL